MTAPSVERQGSILRLAGTVTMDTAGTLAKALDRELVAVSDTAVTLDYSGVDAADSAAVALMVEVVGRLRQRGIAVGVAGLDEGIRNLVHLYGVEWILVGNKADSAH